MALRSTSSLDNIITFLRKAVNAATSTIQTHSESSQTDLALSFATDVSLSFHSLGSSHHPNADAGACSI